MRELSRAEISAEPIEEDLKSFILAELASVPDSCVVKRNGKLFFKGQSEFEILCSRLFEVKARWLELVEYANLAEEDKWQIFCLLIGGDARLEEVPGLGLNLILPAQHRH